LLSSGDVRVLATSTPEGIRKLQERDGALLRRFTAITLDAASVEHALEMLRGGAPSLEAHHGVSIGEPAVGAAVRLAARYVQDRALPDSAFDLLDETAARKRIEVEGVPDEIDGVIRRLESLRAQRLGIDTEQDRESTERRALIDAEIARLEPRVVALRGQLEARKGARLAEAAIRKELEALESALTGARKDNPARAGELEFVQIPAVKARLDAAVAAVGRLDSEGSRSVTESDVARTLETWTGIPVQRMLEGEADKLLKMGERLRARVVGQDEAVAAIARAVRRGRVGLRDPHKPIGSFLFLGPSGVGKTELAKALAEFLFDDEQALTRLDMSEFMERHMAQRLLGAPPGYVDSEQGGFLTEAVRRRPYSVLLFDEVEKAHGDVFNLLLQVLDDGRLTDGRGRLADFSNTVVIMTSNIGSPRILETSPAMFDTDEGREALKGVLIDELKNFFRPEFLNRVDDVIVFRPLRKTDLLDIVDIQLRGVQKLLAPRRLTLELSPAAKQRLVDLSYEPAFGARPLRRTILRELQDPLAESILRAGYADGTKIKVDVKGEEFTFEG
jgi:ATP-dependent Clp protease ATP-binding subunit ClpB